MIIDNMIKFSEKLKNAIFDENFELNKVYIIATQLPRDYIEKFNYDFDTIYNNITKLDESISDGYVYKIFEEGNLQEDGFEKGYLFLTQGSSILLHYHYNEKEHYKCISGDSQSISSDFCNIGSSHKISPVGYDTLVRTFKYIPKSMIK